MARSLRRNPTISFILLPSNGCCKTMRVFETLNRKNGRCFEEYVPLESLFFSIICPILSRLQDLLDDPGGCLISVDN